MVTLLKYSKEIVIYKLKVKNGAIKTYLQFLSIKKRNYFQTHYSLRKRKNIIIIIIIIVIIIIIIIYYLFICYLFMTANCKITQVLIESNCI